MKLKFLILSFFAYSQLTQSLYPQVTYQIQSKNTQQSSFGTTPSSISQFQFDSTRSNSFNPSSYQTVPSSPEIRMSPSAPPTTFTSYTYSPSTSSYEFYNVPPRIEKVQLDPTLVSPDNQVYFSSNRGFNEYIADKAGYPIAGEQRLNKQYPYLGSNVQGRITDPNIVNLFGIKTPHALYQQSIVLPGKFVVYPDLNSGPSQSNYYGSNPNVFTTPQAIMQNPNPTQLGAFGRTQYPSWVPSYYSSPSFSQNIYGMK